MREILFRAKHKEYNEWVEGDLIHESFGECIQFIKNKCRSIIKVDPKTVCQYTGLTDKNGRKIFEGDIVRCGSMLVVTWNEKFAGWCLTKEGWLYNHFFGEACEPGDCEVIGNIFDNPELVKVG